jgi:hypothetical protein
MDECMPAHDNKVARGMEGLLYHMQRPPCCEQRARTIVVNLEKSCFPG